MSDQKRYTPSVSLDAIEREWLKAQAKKKGVSYTRYIRMVALGQLPQAEPLYLKDQPVEFNKGVTHKQMKRLLTHDLSKIGNNLNQLTRHVNETRQIGLKQTQEIEKIREDMDQITDLIFRALR